MHEKSRWINFKMAQNLDHVSFYWDGSLFWAISVFMIEKVSHLSKNTWSRFWAILKLSHLDFSCIWLHVRHVSFDDFLSHLTIPPYTLDNLPEHFPIKLPGHLLCGSFWLEDCRSSIYFSVDPLSQRVWHAPYFTLQWYLLSRENTKIKKKKTIF